MTRSCIGKDTVISCDGDRTCQINMVVASPEHAIIQQAFFAYGWMLYMDTISFPEWRGSDLCPECKEKYILKDLKTG